MSTILSNWLKSTVRTGTRTMVPLILLSILLAGCGTTTGKHNTSGLHLDATVTSEGKGKTTVTVKIFAGSSNALMDNGDTLEVTAYGITKRLSNTGSNFSPEYTTSFDRDDSGETFTFNFKRLVGEVSAPNSNVILPQGFEVTTLIDGQQYSSRDSLQLTWTQDNVNTEINITGNCSQTDNLTPVVTHPISFDISSNTGSMPINITEQLLNGSSLAANEACSVEVKLMRTNIGTADPNFENSSSIVAKQVRTVGTIKIVP
jgi:hypothetical protein